MGVVAHGGEAPGEILVEGGAGDGLGGPVVVSVVRVKGVVKCCLGHEGVELGAEAAGRGGSQGGLAEVACGMDNVSLSLPPLGPAVLEPDLE